MPAVRLGGPDSIPLYVVREYSHRYQLLRTHVNSDLHTVSALAWVIHDYCESGASGIHLTMLTLSVQLLHWKMRYISISLLKRLSAQGIAQKYRLHIFG